LKRAALLVRHRLENGRQVRKTALPEAKKLLADG